MTKIVAQHNDLWTLKKIQSLVDLEATLLKRKRDDVQSKIAAFETQYGKLDRESLYGKVDDMELIEWEGEIETLDRLQEKLTCLQQIAFEYE